MKRLYPLLVILFMVYWACEDKQEKDCAGIEGGTAMLDSCGICIDGTTNTIACTQDCANVWGGTAVIDSCGICEGDNSICSGCTDSTATNYDSSAIIDDGSCCEEVLNQNLIICTEYYDNNIIIYNQQNDNCADYAAECPNSCHEMENTNNYDDCILNCNFMANECYNAVQESFDNSLSEMEAIYDECVAQSDSIYQDTIAQ